MSKHTQVDQSQIMDAIAAIRDLTPSDISQRAQYHRLRHEFGKQDPQVFAEGGPDNKTSSKLADHERNLREISQKREKTLTKSFPKLAKSIQSILDNRKDALELLAGQPVQITTIPLFEAEFVYADPGTILLGQTIAPMHNAAAVYLETPQNGNIPEPPTPYPPIEIPRVSFYFAWQNPFDNTIVINASADIAINGTVTLLGSIWWAPSGTFKVLFGETLIFPLDENGYLGNEITAGSPSPDLVTENVNAMQHFQISNIAIPPQTLVFFEVSFWQSYIPSDGYITADFAFGENYVLCPSVTIEGLNVTVEGLGPRPPIPPVKQ
jgi:hypothetical protein